MRTRIPFLLLIAALPLPWLACDDSSSDTDDTTSPDVSDDDDGTDDDGTSPTTDDDDLTGDTSDTSDDDDSTDTNSDDDDDDSAAMCEPADIERYLTTPTTEDLRWETFCAPDGSARCSPLPARGYIPCDWLVCRIGLYENATELGKCGFCTSDADCTHPNAGYGPGATCGTEEVAPGVRFCVEANGGDWTPGDCSPQDVERFIFSDGEPLIYVACSPSVAARCNYDAGMVLPCGWSRENCAKWNFDDDTSEILECSFCVYDAHCPIGTCSGEWGDGARYCVNPTPTASSPE